MIRHYPALGATSLAVSARVGQLEAYLASFNAQWGASGLRDERLPPAFVLDILSELLDRVITPFTSLRLEMVQRLANVNVARQIGAAGADADAMWRDRLIPVFLQARDLVAKGATTMTVVVPGRRTAEQGLRYHINYIIVAIIAGYEELSAIQEAQPWFLQLGALSDKMIGFFVDAGKMVDQAKRVLAAAGDLVYKPINEAGKWVDRMIKVSAIGVVVYILWATRASTKKGGRR